MEDQYFQLWIITVTTVSSAVIFLLWFSNVVGHYKCLKQLNAPRPFVVNIKQLSITWLVLLPLVLLPGSFLKPVNLKGRKVWLEWDIRWFTADSTLATIEEVLKRPNGYVLLIKLRNSMKLSPSTPPIERIIFEPNFNSKNLFRYYLCAVSGSLVPFGDIPGIEKLINRGYLATCDIVVY